MREMKDSGVPWIGVIPKDWKSTRIKYILKESNIRSIDGQELPLSLGRTCGLIPTSRKEQKTLLSASYVNSKVVFPGEIVFNRFKARLFALSTFHGVVSPDYAVYQDRGKHDLRYFVYLFSTDSYRAAFDNKASGIGDGFSRLYTDDLFSMPTIVPSLSEQQSIADFLDTQCARIDSIMERTMSTLEEYKRLKQSFISESVTRGIRNNRPMKKSGVEWIGDMPVDWNVLPIKQLFVRRSQKNDPIISNERLSLSIDVGITKYAEKTTNLDRFKDDFTQYQIAYPGDIVLNSMNMIVGAVGLSPYFGCVSPVYYVIYPRQKIHIGYWAYVLNCSRIRDVYHSYGQGIYAIERGEGRVNTCRLKVPYDDFERILVPIPSCSEQLEIASYLDEKCSAIDSLIASKEALLRELDSFKKSLIFEYATGKKEVPVQEGGTA